MLTLRNEETGILDVYALHSTDSQLLEAVKGPFNPVGMPAERGARYRKARGGSRYAMSTVIRIRIFGGLWQLGLKSICSVPLITRDRIHRNAGAVSNDGSMPGLPTMSSSWRRLRTRLQSPSRIHSRIES